MAKTSKKKVFSSQAARNKNRAPKTRKPQRAQMGSEIDFDPAGQLSRPYSPNPSPLPRALKLQASPEVLNRL
jgi:hypothetical protein